MQDAAIAIRRAAEQEPFRTVIAYLGPIGAAVILG
ncbi:hypothetical protein V473_08215 [Sphingobium cupriresistens LL01]|uniref:Uncharacterized protein n=1 Tax=Sphingobium cupriresistens LL01 TaxID=1420583 RepID=A0A0J7Y5X2_9SPHN|nr:hypothetical protein V473_08215 [Sphingobium cupriresistens LL01]